MMLFSHQSDSCACTRLWYTEHFRTDSEIWTPNEDRGAWNDNARTPFECMLDPPPMVMVVDGYDWRIHAVPFKPYYNYLECSKCENEILTCSNNFAHAFNRNSNNPHVSQTVRYRINSLNIGFWCLWRIIFLVAFITNYNASSNYRLLYFLMHAPVKWEHDVFYIGIKVRICMTSSFVTFIFHLFFCETFCAIFIRFKCIGFYRHRISPISRYPFRFLDCDGKQ